MNYKEIVQLFFIHPQVTNKQSQNQVESQMSFVVICHACLYRELASSPIFRVVFLLSVSEIEMLLFLVLKEECARKIWLFSHLIAFHRREGKTKRDTEKYLFS